MNKKYLCFYILLLLVSVSIGYAQQEIIYKGKIVNSFNLPLKDVRICKTYNDTVFFQSDAVGEFQISVQTDTKLLFKKNGYAWQIVGVNDNDLQLIKMVYSKSSLRPLSITDQRDESVD